MSTQPPILFDPDDHVSPPPHYLQCGYLLTGLTEPRCPECGKFFDPIDVTSFTRYPGFFFWRYWLPGFALAVAGTGAICLFFLVNGHVGWGLTLGVPFSLGAVLGYGVHQPKRWIAVLSLTGIVFVVGSAMTLRLAGPLCGAILSILFLIPTAIGLLFGSTLRATLKLSHFDQWRHLPTILLLLLPAIVHLSEIALGSSHGPETFVSSRTIAASVEQAWAARLFASPADQRMSFRGWFALASPIPQQMTGEHSAIGASKSIKFNRGKLTLKIIDEVEHRHLAFRFVGQSHLEDRAVKLLDGRIDFAPLTNDAARISLTTHYQPLMTPRWCWRTFEHFTGSRVHNDIFDELELACHESRK